VEVSRITRLRNNGQDYIRVFGYN
jgi:DNA polymerase elongation subunit (family B)